jgi:hypothetical protein
MKPLRGDYRHRLLISGDELRELQRHTGAMAEAFGLDRKIANYRGSRPLTLYRWDLDCLIDVIDLALTDERDYPDLSAPSYLALKMLGERLRREYEAVHGKNEPPSPVKKESNGRSHSRTKRALSKSTTKQDAVYQFKITLLNIQPPIWRRIQVKGCTLDKLHEHIQASMGWTNSHLHEFKVGDQLYGDPMLMAENMEETDYQNSTTTNLSDILPRTGKRIRFVYEYDFGDSWEHEVVFEGSPKPEAGRQYPRCLEGERACPPEDVGGVGGYADFLEAVQDKTHEERAAMFEWVSGWFDPEEFDPETATKSMKKGLPDWRGEE